MRTLAVLLAVLLAAPALAQQGRGPWGKGQQGQGQGQNMSHEERRKLREDVDSARGNYGRPDPRRQGRMDPEEREKLRRDVQDANSQMRKK